MAPARGTTLALLGVALFVVTMAAGAVTAPDRTVAGGDVSTPTPTPTPADTAAGDSTPTDTPTPLPAPRTLVGIQGGWVTHGNLRMYEGPSEQWRETSIDTSK